MPKITQSYWSSLITQALKEDLGRGDITTNILISNRDQAQAIVLMKSPGVVCGLDVAAAVFRRLDPKIIIRKQAAEGDVVQRGQVLMTIKGRTRAILTAERVALNFLAFASSIATQTRFFVEAVKPHRVQILDTRKTIPTLRALQRYAVTIGGGVNHRFNLHDAVMIKDNHRVRCGATATLAETVRLMRQRTRKKIIVEVDTIKELRDVLTAHPDVVLLDNLRGASLKKAVALIKECPKKYRPLIEASGGISLKSVKLVAAAGVDRISIGALTHSIKSVDVSLELQS